MSTFTIDATQPGATAGWTSANVTTLKNCVANILTADRISGPITLSPDEYQVLWALIYGNADAKTNTIGTSTISSIVTTYS